MNGRFSLCVIFFVCARECFAPDTQHLEQHVWSNSAICHFMISDVKTTLMLFPKIRDDDAKNFIVQHQREECVKNVLYTIAFVITHLQQVSHISTQPTRVTQISCSSAEQPLGVCVDRHE